MRRLSIFNEYNRNDIVHNEKSLEALNGMEELLDQLDSKEEGLDGSAIEAKIIARYKLYLENFEKDIDFTRRNIRRHYVKHITNSPKGKYKSPHLSIMTYRELLNTLYKRDMTKLARNGSTLKDLYLTQENWLHEMKFQITKRLYIPSTKYH